MKPAMCTRGWDVRIHACRALLAFTKVTGLHLLILFLCSVSLVISLTAVSAHAKTPGKTYCYKRICHRVKTISETRAEIGKQRVIYASHYDHCGRDRYNPCGLTSSGERFRPNAPDNAASPVYPDGTRLLVWNPVNGKTVVVRINNAGPYWRRRKLDLSRAAADKLGFRRRGVARLYVKVLSAPTRAEARYRRERRYKPVPGFVGAFQSIDTALLSVGRVIRGLFGSPVHAVAGRAPPSARSRRIVQRELRRNRRIERRILRRHRSVMRRIAATPPPLPVAKSSLVVRPVMQLANAELTLHEYAYGVQIALPLRRPQPPMPPLPIAGFKQPEKAAQRFASIRRLKRRRVAALKGKAVHTGLVRERRDVYRW